MNIFQGKINIILINRKSKLIKTKKLEEEEKNIYLN